MPYNNLPESQWGKMDRCVTRVQATGKPKKRAIAICYSSIAGKKDDEMSNSRKRKKNRQFQQDKLEREAEERGEMLGLVGTDKLAEVQEEQVIEPLEEEVELTPAEEKLGEAIVEEIETEDADNEDGEDDGEEKEVRLEEEETVDEDSLAKQFWTFLKAKIGGVVRNGSQKIRSSEKRMKIGEEKKDFVPFQVFKDKKGDYRYVAVVTNNYVDKDNDIVTGDAHMEFMDYLDAHPQEAPELWVWHTPGTAHKSRADFWTYDNGFVMYSGKLTEEEADRAEKAAAYAELGMSHGMNVYGLKRDERPKLITKYRTFEISYLPLSNAANPWTAWSVIQKEVETMKDEKRKFLEETLGQEVTANLIADTGKAKQVLDALNVASKETEEETPAQPVEPTLDAEAIVKTVVEKLGVSQLSEVIKGLSDTVEELKADRDNIKKDLAELRKTEDEKVAELVQTTPSQQYFWLSKAQSQSEQTVVDEKDPIVQETPKPSWLSEVYPR